MNESFSPASQIAAIYAAIRAVNGERIRQAERKIIEANLEFVRRRIVTAEERRKAASAKGGGE